jgi:hypothetical protein
MKVGLTREGPGQQIRIKSAYISTASETGYEAHCFPRLSNSRQNILKLPAE